VRLPGIAARYYLAATFSSVFSRLRKEFTNRFPEIPWGDIVGFRNIAVHEYFAVRWDIAWTAATEEVPVLREQIENILREEFQG